MNDLTWKTPAIFVVVLVAVVGVAALAGVVMSDTPEYEHDTPSVPDVENQQYNLDRFDIDGAPGQAAVSMDSDETNATVVVDVGPGVPPRQIQPLVNTLTDNGHEVAIRGGGPTAAVSSALVSTRLIGSVGQSREELPPLERQLEEAHAYVSVGVTGYTGESVEALETFVDDDGRVLMLTEPEQSFTGDHAMFEVQSTLGVGVEPGYVYNLEENDLNYQRVFTEPAPSSSLTADVSRVVFDTAQPVETDDGTGLLDVIEGTELSTTRAPVDASVLARDGNVAIVGDTDFISPENTQRADNDELLGNLADFLVTGDRDLTADEGEAGSESAAKTITVGPDGEPTFEPRGLEIEKGTTVRFEWASDGYALNVTDQPAGANWEGVPQPQSAGTVHVHTFEVEGIYRFEAPGYADQGMIGGIAVGNPEELR